MGGGGRDSKDGKTVRSGSKMGKLLQAGSWKKEDGKRSSRSSLTRTLKRQSTDFRRSLRRKSSKAMSFFKNSVKAKREAKEQEQQERKERDRFRRTNEPSGASSVDYDPVQDEKRREIRRQRSERRKSRARKKSLAGGELAAYDDPFASAFDKRRGSHSSVTSTSSRKSMASEISTSNMSEIARLSRHSRTLSFKTDRVIKRVESQRFNEEEEEEYLEEERAYLEKRASMGTRFL